MVEDGSFQLPVRELIEAQPYGAVGLDERRVGLVNVDNGFMMVLVANDAQQVSRLQPATAVFLIQRRTLPARLL